MCIRDRRKDSKEIYTLRIIRKITLLDTNLITVTFIEEEAKKSSSNPFLLQPEFVYKKAGAICILFNFIIGKNMAQVLKEEKRMNERKVCFFGYQIALAIKRLHENNITYSYLRTENILIDENNYIYLNDFGIHKFMSPDNRKAHTSSMVVKYPLTQEYLPPEYFLKDEVAPAADWWAFGVVLYELLTGITPFSSKDSIVSCEVTFPAPFKHHILLTDGVQEVVKGLLSKNPVERLNDSVLECEFFQEKEWTHDEMLEKKVNQSYIFLQKSVPITNSILSNNVEEPITQLYPAIPRDEMRKKFEQP
eukprot:TRINITY_DN26214_c0_g1_i2.p1 TRINITY_DN26214_c0_g1~~TRINITY_DN26214_c0_g1_i2.p1  ORF type:complete len:306 (-),score=59.12 TRINITY_DN26214_c0_g1_i2:45-962(-)